MNYNELIDRLGSVERVDPPPFLFTRIEARIAARTAALVPHGRMVLVGLSLSMLLVANAAMFWRNATSHATTQDPMDNVVSVMGLNASNQLYHD